LNPLVEEIDERIRRIKAELPKLETRSHVDMFEEAIDMLRLERKRILSEGARAQGAR
jgi:hypothetical protein